MDIEKFMPFELRYQEAYERFSREYPVALTILDVCGVHPEKTRNMPNPYMVDAPVDTQDFSNIGKHCVAVGLCAERIVSALVSSGVLDAAAGGGIVGRALVHDANKRFEIFRRDAQKAGVPISAYSEEGYNTLNDVLVSAGISDEALLKYVHNAGKETGHLALKDFIHLDENSSPCLNPNVSLEEMVVRLADDMVASPLPGRTKNTDTQFVTIAERMDLGNFTERYPFLYTEGLGFDSVGKVISVKDIKEIPVGVYNVRTLAEWQERVASLICVFLQKSIDSSSVENPDEYIKKIVNKY